MDKFIAGVSGLFGGAKNVFTNTQKEVLLKIWSKVSRLFAADNSLRLDHQSDLFHHLEMLFLSKKGWFGDDKWGQALNQLRHQIKDSNEIKDSNVGAAAMPSVPPPLALIPDMESLEPMLPLAKPL